MTKKPIAEQVVVVTGASAGLGRAIARAAAARGAKVVLAARGSDGLDAAVAELGPNAHGVQADVASLDAEFRHALTVHRAGDPAAAAQLYSAILEMDPRHAGAMHLLGVTHAERGEYDEACQLIGAALRAAA